MKGKGRKQTAKEQPKVERPQGFAEMCRQMMSGEMPDCCGPEMREMMSRWMAEAQAE